MMVYYFLVLWFIITNACGSEPLFVSEMVIGVFPPGVFSVQRTITVPSACFSLVNFMGLLPIFSDTSMSAFVE